MLLLATFAACSAFRQECKEEKVWEIENYKIIKKRCIGLAGPPFYPVYLYKDNVEIDHKTFQSNSCIMNFNDSDDKIIQFDLCTNEIIRN